jgi:hypothetical protein
VWPFSRGCDDRLLAVLCDQRLMFADGGDVAAVLGAVVDGVLVVWGWPRLALGSASWRSAARFTVTTDDEMDVVRELVRRWVRAVSWCCSGGPAGLLMLASRRRAGGLCLRTKTSMQAGCRHGAAGPGTRAGRLASR